MTLNEMDERDPLDRLAEEFMERFRRGECPAVAEFVVRAPAQSAQLRELLSALVMVEDLRSKRDDTESSIAQPASVEIERLGDYRIIREVGRGGMGVVFEAEQISLGRRVALKVLARGPSRSRNQRERFLREARAAAQLQHANIVPIFGVGEEDGVYFYAMQFIRGQGLDSVLAEVKRHKGGRGGRAGSGSATRECSPDAPITDDGWEAQGLEISPDLERQSLASAPVLLPGEVSIAAATGSDERYARSVARIGVQVADALEYAHRHGTLHRDIKPSNLLLDGVGNVWVTDFGLAKAIEDDDLTRTGDVVGTLRYMAPERFRGDCDARSDVHALGLTLYELLALRPAFDAPERDRLIYQVTHLEPPRLRTLNPEVPRDLETIIHKAFESSSLERYPSALAMAEDLRRFLDHRPIQARRLGTPERLSRWARRNPGLASLGTALAFLLAVTVVVIAAANWNLRRANRDALKNLGRATSAEKATAAKFVESSLARARALRRTGVAGRRFDGLRSLEEAVRLEEGSSRRFEFRTEAIGCLALADLRPIVTWPELVGHERARLDVDPTMTRVAMALPGGPIEIREISSGRRLIMLGEASPETAIVRFSPDGRYLAAKQDAGPISFAVYDVAQGEAVLRLPEGIIDDAFDFHPDSSTIATGRRDGTITFHELPSGREVGRMRPITLPESIRFDPSGDRIAIASWQSAPAVQVRRVRGGGVSAEWMQPEGAMCVAWHPDGRWLAAGGADGRIHLFDVDSPSSAPRRLERHGNTIVDLAFHPSGELLASAAWDGTVRLWQVATGHELVKQPVQAMRRLRFSDDGTSLGPGEAAGVPCLWAVAEGREYWPAVAGVGPFPIRSIATVTPEGLIVAASPIGLVFSAGDLGASTVAAMPETIGALVLPDGQSVISGGNWGLLRWPFSRGANGRIRVGPPAALGPRAGESTLSSSLGGDGRTLAVIMNDERGGVMVLDLAGERAPVALIEHRGADRVAVSPDGRQVATGTWKGTGVKIWDARRGTLTADLAVAGSASVLFSPDGRWLLTGSSSDYVLWDVNRWVVARRITREPTGGLPGEAAFREDGRMLAVARSRSLLQLMDPATGSELATLESSDPQLITALAFTPHGRLLVAQAGSDEIRAWDLQAVRRGLALLGLDWQDSRPLGKSPPRPTPARETIEVVGAPWLELFQEGDRLARAGRINATAYRESIERGAPGALPWARLALAHLALGDHSNYVTTCRQLLEKVRGTSLAPNTANDVAWICAVGPSALVDYALAVQMAELAAAWGEANRLNTLGAILYRAGRYQDAIKELSRSVAVHGGGGTQIDALFLAMAHHRLGHAEEARTWLRRASGTAAAPMRKPDMSRRPSWIPAIELEIVRREATALVEPREG